MRRRVRWGLPRDHLTANLRKAKLIAEGGDYVPALLYLLYTPVQR